MSSDSSSESSDTDESDTESSSSSDNNDGIDAFKMFESALVHRQTCSFMLNVHGHVVVTALSHHVCDRHQFP